VSGCVSPAAPKKSVISPSGAIIFADKTPSFVVSSRRYQSPHRARTLAGRIFFTLALKYENPTAVNVILNIQPVISTIARFVLFGDRLARQFFLCAGLTIVAGIFISVAYLIQIGVSFDRALSN